MRKVLSSLLTLWFFICIYVSWETFYEIFFVPPSPGIGDLPILALPVLAVLNFFSFLLCVFVQRRWLLPLKAVRLRRVAKVTQWGLLTTVIANALVIGVFLFCQETTSPCAHAIRLLLD